MLSLRDSPENKINTQRKSKGVEKSILCIWKGKKARVAVLISNKIDFKTKAIVKTNKDTT